jgi:nucleoside-diphosphate-sugar epimerase
MVRKVVVTGAGSSVGYEVFKKLLKRKTFSPVAVVRDKSAYNDLIRIGATPDQVKIADITKRDSLRGVFNGASKVVLCTSAQPQVRLRYRVKNFFRSIIGKARSPRPKDLKYERGQEPYNVDFLGQKNVIDLAVRERVEHIVMVGNMGGYRGSKLNDIGRSSSSSSNGDNDSSINSNNSGREEDPKKGNILKWKRAAERYLMKRCFFTILHAGALTDDPPGQRDVVFDNDDALLRTNFKTIPCKDLAEVVVQSLVWKEAIGRSLDVAAREKGTGSSKTQDWLRFWSTPGNNLYPADDL